LFIVFEKYSVILVIEQAREKRQVRKVENSFALVMENKEVRA